MAAEPLALPVRQVRRLPAHYHEDGAAALVHGDRRRIPTDTITTASPQRIVHLAQTRDAVVNDRHLRDLLANNKEITVSRLSLRRMLRGAGIASPRTRRPAKHRQRRERKAQAGMRVQLDASPPHAWLEERGPRLSLIAPIDDATNTLAAAVFGHQEDAHGYFQVVQHVVTTPGVPREVYHHRHGIFRPVDQKETLAEQLTREREPTQFGRLLRTLGVGSIAAHFPQARG